MLIIVAYSVLGMILFFMQPMFVYSPTKWAPYTPADIGLAYDKVTLRTSDRLLLSGWYIPAHNAEVTILFCHGKGGSISYYMDTINLLNELGFNVFIFDYRGFGNSEGKTTEQGTYLDARAAYEWLVHDKGLQPGDIIIFGRSLGGSIAAQLASNVAAKGLIIESSFTSFVDLGVKCYPYMPVRLFARFSYNTGEYLKKVKYPVLIVHSRDDEIVPFEFGLRLYEGFANEPRDFLEIYGCHNDGFLHSSEIYREGLINWAESLDAMKSQQKRNFKIVT
jgi:fermentation-respiration switch protein FrsA (DUF1100 family)